MAERKKVPWLKIIDEYSQGLDIAELGRKYGLARESISRKKTQDEKAGRPWPKKVDVHHAAVTAVTEQIAQQVRADIAADLQRHSVLSDLLMEASESTLQEYINGNIKPSDKQNKADVLNSLAAAVARAVQTSRDINGIRSGQPSTGDSNDDGKRRFTFTMAAPERQAEAS